MAKEVESCNEPSQSSSTLPPLAENEVELVIERFWRDTRPRVCVRSETKMVNGFNFRLLVWPQGSKQSQSHLSAFVEVVPPSTLDSKKDSEDSSSLSRQYPPDWACPCVFYRISVMNFKQKYPYSKADTWTFSYVCPDRGWHTLLDTRYINRRDGYLSNEGSLVIRAIAFPRFGHSISVLPLLNNVSHSEDVPSSSSSSSSVAHFGMSNFLATDHINCLVQSLFHIPGFRKFLYSLRRKSAAPWLSSASELDPVELETIEQGLKSCSETIKEIMTRVTNAAPDVSRLIQNEFFSDCQDAGLCHCHKSTGAFGSRTTNLARQYGRCKVLINCLEESLYSVSQSLFGRKRSMSSDIASKRVQFDAYRHIVRDCKRILSTVAHNLFIVETSGETCNRANLVEELQMIFAKLEYGESVSCSSQQRLIDSRGLIRELGLSSGGLTSAASPDGVYIVMLEGLKKAVSEMTWMTGADSRSESPIDVLLALIEGVSVRPCNNPDSVEETLAFTHLRFGNTKATTIDKHVAAWVSGSAPEISENETLTARFTKLPRILNMQFLSKVKDRLDVSERIGLEHYVTGAVEADIAPESTEEEPILPRPMTWDVFLDHLCEADSVSLTSSSREGLKLNSQYRLHSITFCSGEYSGGHYSVIVRNHRMGGWTRYDDAWKEDLIDVCGAATSQNPSGPVTSNPDWVFSPEWSCSSVTYVREDAIDDLYSRGADVRLIRPDLFSRGVAEMDTSDLTVGSSVLCNRSCPMVPIPASPDAAKLDPTCQVEISLITEKDVMANCPGGFSVPFSFVVPNATRKLIVRKDIPVERLMKAVAEHFKIPVQLQRLFALRYYPETVQERFELMQTHRSILAYLPIDAAPGKDTSVSGAKSGISRALATSSSLYVLVSGRRSMTTTEVTVWVKVLDEKTMGLISVCLLSVDPSKCLKDYADQVSAKVLGNASFKANGLLASIESDTQFIVFEEIGPRTVELRRTTAAIKNEKIIDGDVLIFVPLTDSAKRSLIGSAAGLGNIGQGTRPKRRVHQLLSGSAIDSEVRESIEDDLSESEFSSSCDEVDDSIYSDSDVEEIDSNVDLNERCRRFLTRAGKVADADDDSLIDEAYEEMILGELMREEEEAGECHEPGCVCSCQDSRLEAIRRLIRGTASTQESTGKRLKKTRRNHATTATTQRPKLADIMNDIMKEFDSGKTTSDSAAPLNLFDGMTKDELGKLMSKKADHTKRLDVPSELKDELNRIPCPMCFYCQLPLTAAKAPPSAVPPAKVSCSVKCVDHPLVYHDRCVQDLVRETGTDACVVTEGCHGKVIVEPKSVIAGLITKKDIKLSTAALRSKLGSVLAMPSPPSLGKGGQITPAIKEWAGKGSAPSLPSGLKLNPAVKKGAKKGSPSLPSESLWWNACLLAFGGQENLQTVVVDNQWDASDLVQAKNIFLHWCKLLLEKQSGKKTPPPAVNRAVSNVTAASKQATADSSSCSSDETSSSDDDSSSVTSETVAVAPVTESVISLEPDLHAPYVDGTDSNDDDDDGFILVGAGASSRKHKRPESDASVVQTPTSAAVSTTNPSAVNSPNIQVVIPQGFLGQPVTKEQEEERADKAAASIAEQAVSSLLYADLVDFEEVEPTTSHLYTPPTPSPAISLVETLTTSNALLEERMNLLPVSVRQYCLPVELVFVYYSEQFFGDKQAKTVSLIPSVGLSQEEILDSITLAAFNLSAVISRLFTSPHQALADSLPIVQWFVEFETPSDSQRFTEWVASACPEWAPESGALLPASMLGFAV